MEEGCVAKRSAEEEVKELLKPVRTKLDQLDATVTGLSTLRETYDTRFTMLSEKIGEVRSMVLTQAKESADAKAKAERALLSLEGVKPEEFRAAIIKRDAEIESIKARLTSLNDMIRSLMDEMKEFRNMLAKFKGLETVIGMADDARRNIIRIQQVRDQVEVMSDKVMSAFLEFQRRFKDVTDLSVRVAALDAQVKPMTKTVNQMDVLVKQAVSKAELSKLTGDIETLRQAAAEIREYHGRLSTGQKELGKLKAEFQRAVRHVDSKNRKEITRINARLRVIERVVSRILKLILSAK
jgi:predicted  nucleic acid-binding Zn-ribbon protein